jgi:hypothetical protein
LLVLVPTKRKKAKLAISLSKKLAFIYNIFLNQNTTINQQFFLGGGGGGTI